jgi:hypothetical protein
LVKEIFSQWVGERHKKRDSLLEEVEKELDMVYSKQFTEKFRWDLLERTTSLKHKTTSFYWIKKRNEGLRLKPCGWRLVTRILITFKKHSRHGRNNKTIWELTNNVVNKVRGFHDLENLGVHHFNEIFKEPTR